MFGKKSFGRKKPIEPRPQPTSYQGGNRPSDASRRQIPQLYREADGKVRAIPKAVFEGKHGKFLRDLGFDPDDESNIIPQTEDFDRMVQESLARQEERRCRLEASLLEKYTIRYVRSSSVVRAF